MAKSDLVLGYVRFCIRVDDAPGAKRPEAVGGGAAGGGNGAVGVGGGDEGIAVDDVGAWVREDSAVVAAADAGALPFDGRHDLLAVTDMAAISAELTFTNMRRLTDGDCRGLRRTVIVALTDIKTGQNVCTMPLKVNIPKGELLTVCRVDFPVFYDDIYPDHSFRLSVFLKKDGTPLGESVFNLFDSRKLEKYPDEWYVAERGYIHDIDDPDYIYRSFEEDKLCYKVARFDLRINFAKRPRKLPELELRICFPDGDLASQFVTPVDDGEGKCHVEAAFLVNIYNRGVCYAELLSMDFALAGFVFNTSGPFIGGCWEGKALDWLRDYTLRGATERFHLLAYGEPDGIAGENA